MDMQEKIKIAQRNIWKAVENYGAHAYQTAVLDDISEKFVARLARDNAYAKEELRNLFRKSLVWDEELDSLIINGTRTHDPDYRRVRRLAEDILYSVRQDASTEKGELIDRAIVFFTHPEENPEWTIAAIQELAPKAYAPKKKPSRVFRALCDALGVSDDAAGSRFQRLYAQFADEISSRKIDFKLYVSLNPAHFLTMSNPKTDKRGSTLTSCHSLNSTEYSYNCGCSGYARDNYTFTTFIAADPDNPETLNNRKTMRQIFAYKPGNGLLLQSRLYNTEGGTYGAQKDSNHEGNEIYVCASCRDRYYAYCYDCGYYYPREDVVVIADNRCVCQECLEAHYSKCDACGRYCRDSELQEGLCPACHAERERGLVA